MRKAAVPLAALLLGLVWLAPAVPRPPHWGQYRSGVTVAAVSTAGLRRTCYQAGYGKGTGAWYRVDSNCLNSNWNRTIVTFCWARVTARQRGDGFYQSLGVYNTKNGYAADAGFTYVPERRIWASFAADQTGWKYGTILVDPERHPCVDVSLQVGNRQLTMAAQDSASGRPIGKQTFRNLDPELRLNAAGEGIGFYRFDSIAQLRETLVGGSRLERAAAGGWRFYDGVTSVPAAGLFVNRSGNPWPPGPCCGWLARWTVSVHAAQEWEYSDVSITYGFWPWFWR